MDIPADRRPDMSKFGPVQPKGGDCVLHCGHTNNGLSHHWWGAPDGIQFKRPDGTKGVALWIVTCEKCFTAADGDFDKIQIRGDGRWIGDEPAILAPS